MIENCEMGEITTKFAGEIKELDCSGCVAAVLRARLQACWLGDGT